MSTPRKNKAFQHAAPTLGADFQRVDFEQAARRVEEEVEDEASCHHQEKWSFATIFRNLSALDGVFLARASSPHGPNAEYLAEVPDSEKQRLAGREKC